ncbi:hypothetical protein EDB19DRAFT_1693690 [Suillus lakei]|nr:hypothetical protein EDB19DRAFT_1693690 [Suillus lakei]
MIALFNQLLADGMSPHVAWRVAFAIAPVPILLSASVDDIETGDKKDFKVTITAINMVSELDAVVNEPLTLSMADEIILNPLTWLPSLAYMTTFGYELAIDANLANVLYTLLESPTFGQTKAGYVNLLEQSLRLI